MPRRSSLRHRARRGIRVFRRGPSRNDPGLPNTITPGAIPLGTYVAPLVAQVAYVDAQNGTDTGFGGSSAFPWRTLPYAAAQAATGTQIRLRGTFRPNGDGLPTPIGTTPSPAVSTAKTLSIVNDDGYTVRATGLSTKTGWTSDGAGHWYISWALQFSRTASVGEWAGRNVITRTVTLTNGQSLVNDAAITAADDGKMIYLTNLSTTSGFPGGTVFIKNVVPNTSYQLSSTWSTNTPVNFTGTTGAFSVSFGTPFCPEIVQVDGTRLWGAPNLASCTSSEFFTDWNAARLYIATDPTGHTVEVSESVGLFNFTVGGNGSSVDGIQIDGFGSTQAQLGAIRNAQPNFKQRHCLIQDNGRDGQVVSGSTATGPLTEHCTIRRSGRNGMLWNSFDTPVGTLTDFHHNDFDSCVQDPGWNVAIAGNWKITGVTGALNADLTTTNKCYQNLTRNAVKGKGGWWDVLCSFWGIYDIVTFGNSQHGLDVEISDNMFVINILTFNNSDNGILADTVTNSELWFITTLNNGGNPVTNGEAGIYGHDNNRTDKPAPNQHISNLRSRNNVISVEGASFFGTRYYPKTQIVGGDSDTNRLPDECNFTTDSNAYYWKAGKAVGWMKTPRTTAVNTAGSPHNLSAVQDAALVPLGLVGQENHSFISTAVANPYITDAAAHRYEMPATADAYLQGEVLPDNVARVWGHPEKSGKRLSPGVQYVVVAF